MTKKVDLILNLLFLVSILLSACGGGNGQSAIRGKDLFAQNEIGSETGCRVCHSLESDTILIGPSLSGIATIAAERQAGVTAEDYLYAAIIDPDAYLAEGFPPGVMPAIYNDLLSEKQINELVAYLLTLK